MNSVIKDVMDENNFNRKEAVSETGKMWKKLDEEDKKPYEEIY